jgi:putative restriction endonuclease
LRFQAQHVQQAFELIRRNGTTPNRQSTKWDIIDPETNERFPPKAVLRVAKEIAQDDSYSGGGGPFTNGPLKSRGFDIVLKEGLESSEIAEDIKGILNCQSDETTKERLINARLGQGGFREGLIEIWDGKCALTGCDILETLRASHIKPWRLSDDLERLDAANGLLLAASIDALFDKFLITFDVDGSVLVSPKLGSKDLGVLGLQYSQKIKLRTENEKFMHWHRDKFFSEI